MTETTTLISLEKAEELAGWTVKMWPGKCYGIASAIAEAVGGVPMYGHWIGPVAEREDKLFAYARQTGFARHGWVELPDRSIVDPTRWVFEDVAPYIYHGPNDYYDFGASRFRGVQPRPTLEEAQKEALTITVKLSGVLVDVVHATLGRDIAGFADMYWLAHQTPDAFAPHAAELYEWFEVNGFTAWIPIDFQRAVRAGVRG